MSKNSIFYVIFSSIVVLLTALIFFLMVLAGATFILANVLPGAKTGGGEAAVTVGSTAMALAFLLSPLSLIPSYKLLLRLARWMGERRGVKIENPKRLFLVALGILFLPLVLLIILGVLQS